MGRLSTASVIVLAVALIVAGLTSIAIMPTRGGGGRTALEYLAVGSLFGLIFGHSVVASAWSALGPGPALIRIPLAVFWCLLVWIAVTINLTIWKNGPREEIMVVMGLCISGIWLVGQTPYWLLRAFGQLKIARRDQSSAAADAPPQFGIGQLLIFTTIIALIFGAGRIAFSLFPVLETVRGGEAMVFFFLAVAAVLLSLPLVPAVLLPKYAASSTVICLLLIGLATTFEFPIYQQTLSGRPGPQFMHFVWINAATAFWILVIGLVMRLGGYQLAPRRTAAPVSAPFQ